jgi:hypothetical protein
MGRFSPTVQRKGGLAQALQQGVQGYQEGQDRELRRDITMANEGRTARASEINALERGWRPELGDALMQAPQFQPNSPLDFNRETRMFTPQPISPTEAVQMQAGGVWNPALPREQKVQETMALGGAKIDLGAMERNRLQSEFGGAVEQAGGMPEASRDLGLIRDYLGQDAGNLQLIPENTASGARIFDRKTGMIRSVPGSTPLPRSGAAGADGGLTVAERNKVTQIEDLQSLIRRATTAQVGPDGRPVKSGRVAGVVPLPTWVRSQFDIGGAPSMQLQLLIGDLTSQVGNLRSGGAITPEEFDRLETFLPTMNERPEMIAMKLRTFAETLDDMMTRRRARMNLGARRGNAPMEDPDFDAWLANRGMQP